jgi:hypothetical protein
VVPRVVFEPLLARTRDPSVPMGVYAHGSSGAHPHRRGRSRGGVIVVSRGGSGTHHNHRTPEPQGEFLRSRWH